MKVSSLRGLIKNEPEKETMKTVLIVDDEKLFLASLTEGLASFGGKFKVLTANNGKQAIDIISSQPIDLIVTDLKMPVLDGFQLLLYLMKENYNMPVIVMTAFGTPEIESKIKEYQAFSYLEKPVDFQKLADKINEGLSQTQTGNLSGISLFSFLQLIHVEQKTCQLKVITHGKAGTLYFSKGELFDAASGQLKGEEAALEIVCWEEVEIEIVNIFKKIKQRIRKPLPNILMDAAQIKDEASFQNESEGVKIRSEIQADSSEEELLNQEIEEIMRNQFRQKMNQTDSSAAQAEIQPNKNQIREEIKLSMANNVNQSLEELMNIEGAKAVALVDSNSGMALGTAGSGVNLEVAAAGNSEVIKAKFKTMQNLGLKDKIEDILITLGEQYHLIRTLKDHGHLFFYVVLTKQNANLAMARFKLSDVESKVEV
jgi:CheY-like chemotaxis protein/predicted regulator of Ras-like GTPase activity (Roadblock/LC7/MglB family)